MCLHAQLVRVRLKGINENAARLCASGRKAAFLDVGKAQEDDRHGALQRAHLLIAPNVKPLEQIGASGESGGEERLEHGEVERLAEAPGSGDKGHLVACEPPFPDEAGLIHYEVAVLAHVNEALVAYADCPAHADLPKRDRERD